MENGRNRNGVVYGTSCTGGAASSSNKLEGNVRPQTGPGNQEPGVFFREPEITV